MFAATLGWLSATPDGSKEPRYKYISGVGLPEIPPDDEVCELWQRSGMSSNGGLSGPSPLTWLEIDAFARLRGVSYHAIIWDTLRDMSVAYVEALGDKNPLSIPPEHRGET